MEQYATRNFILEYTNVADVVTNREWLRCLDY
jgi:hypothetical protein